MQNWDIIIIAVNNYRHDKWQRGHLLMPRLSQVPVDLREVREEQETGAFGFEAAVRYVGQAAVHYMKI